MTVEKSPPASAKHLFEGRIIPFRGIDPSRLHIASPVFAPSTVRETRTLRPTDVLLLLPIIAPITAMILLALLGWFIAWLAIVGLLVAAIVTADITRIVLRRLFPPPIGALDRQAVSYQGP